jgi:hypothetical protein
LIIIIPLISPLNININHHSSSGPSMVTRVAGRFRVEP